MKTFRHFWRYLAKFFLEWEMFWTKVVEKMKTQSHRLWNDENCGDRGARNDFTIWRIRPLARVPTCTHSRPVMHTQTNMWYVLLIHSNNGFVNAFHCYSIACIFMVILTWLSAVSYPLFCLCSSRISETNLNFMTGWFRCFRLFKTVLWV
jgi:hypothetical protein